MTITTEPELFHGYAQAHPTPEPFEYVVMERIRDLWSWRAWYRRRADWASFTGIRQQHMAELRGLVRLARLARRLEAGRPDPMTLAAGAAASHEQWVEAELREAWGR